METSAYSGYRGKQTVPKPNCSPSQAVLTCHHKTRRYKCGCRLSRESTWKYRISVDMCLTTTNFLYPVSHTISRHELFAATHTSREYHKIRNFRVGCYLVTCCHLLYRRTPPRLQFANVNSLSGQFCQSSFGNFPTLLRVSRHISNTLSLPTFQRHLDRYTPKSLSISLWKTVL